MVARGSRSSQCTLQIVELSPEDAWGSRSSIVVSDGEFTLKGWFTTKNREDTGGLVLLALGDVVRCSVNMRLCSGRWLEPPRKIAIEMKFLTGDSGANFEVISAAQGIVGHPEDITVLLPQMMHPKPPSSLFHEWFSAAFPYGKGGDFYLTRPEKEKSTIDYCLGLQRHVVAYVGGRVEASALIACCRAMTHTTSLVCEARASHLHRSTVLSEEARAVREHGDLSAESLSDLMLDWLGACGPSNLRQQLADPSSRARYHELLVDVHTPPAAASKNVDFAWGKRLKRSLPGFVALPSGAYAQLGKTWDRIKGEYRERESESIEFEAFGPESDYILARAPEPLLHGQLPKYLPLRWEEIATKGHKLDQAKMTATSKAYSMYTMPLSIRDLAHVTIECLYGNECTTSSIAALGHSPVAMRPSNESNYFSEYCKFEQLPMSHATSWLVLALCSRAWSSCSFLDRSIPLRTAISVIRREFAPRAVPWEGEAGIFGIVGEFLLTPWEATNRGYYCVSNFFNAVLSKVRQESSLKAEFVRPGNGVLDRDGASSLVKTLHRCSNASALTIEDMSLETTDFLQVFDGDESSHPNLTDIRVAKCPGFTAEVIKNLVSERLVEIRIIMTPLELNALGPLATCTMLTKAVFRRVGVDIGPLAACYSLREIFAEGSFGADNFLTACEQRRLGGLPFPQLKVLDLSFSDCHNLWPLQRTFASSLKKLNLVACHLNSLDPLVHQGLPCLEEIYFNGCTTFTDNVDSLMDMFDTCPRLGTWGRAGYRDVSEYHEKLIGHWRPRRLQGRGRERLIGTLIISDLKTYSYSNIPSTTFPVGWLLRSLKTRATEVTLSLQATSPTVAVTCIEAELNFKFLTEDSSPRLLFSRLATEYAHVNIRTGSVVKSIDGARSLNREKDDSVTTFKQCLLEIEVSSSHVCAFDLLLNMFKDELSMLVHDNETDNATHIPLVEDDLWCTALDVFVTQTQVCMFGGTRSPFYSMRVTMAIRALELILRFHSPSTIATFAGADQDLIEKVSNVLRRVLEELEVSNFPASASGVSIPWDFECPTLKSLSEDDPLFCCIFAARSICELLVGALRAGAIAGVSKPLAEKLSEGTIVTLLKVLKKYHL